MKKEKFKDHVRRHYLFPAIVDAPFSIKCYADYFGPAKVPSLKVCEASVTASEPIADEYAIRLTDEKSVGELFKAISYGEPDKRFFSHERVYGKSHDGVFRNLFRFSFSCLKDSCLVTFSPKKSDT